jgi:hypothetical protein
MCGNSDVLSAPYHDLATRLCLGRVYHAFAKLTAYQTSMIDVKNWTRGVAKCRYFAKGLKAPRAIASQINRAVALAIDQKSAHQM